MERMNELKLIGSLVSLCILISSCASTTLQPGAQNVQIAVGPVPKGCVFRADIDGALHEAPMGKHTDIENSQTIILKNQSAKVGANVVFVTTHKTVYYPQFIASLGDWIPTLDSHTLDGKAYMCTSYALNQMKHRGVSHLSEVESVSKNW